MAHVCDLFVACCALDVVYHGNEVNCRVRLLIEVKELLFVIMVVQSHVPVRVLVATQVAKPDIVTSVSYCEGWCSICLVCQECIRRVHDAVLQEDWRLHCFVHRLKLVLL